MRKTIFTVIILLALIATAGYFYVSKKSTTIKQELSDFSVKDTASIDKIFLSNNIRNEKILLEKNEDGSWTLNNTLIARQDAVNTLLTTIKKISVRAPVPRASFENIVKSISGNSTKVEIYQGKDKPSKVYYVGIPNKDHTGTYMLLEDSSVPFLMHIEGLFGFLGPRYFTRENDWRDRTVFKNKYGDIASIKVEHPQENEKSFEILFENGNPELIRSIESGEEFNRFDTAFVYDYVRRYKVINFESFEENRSRDYIDSLVKVDPVQQIYTVKNTKGKTSQIKTFLKPANKELTNFEDEPVDYDIDRMYGQLNDTDFVVIQYFVFDPLNKEIADFIVEK